jgi:hypothetical protein
MIKCLPVHIHTLALLMEVTDAEKQGATSVCPNVVARDR